MALAFLVGVTSLGIAALETWLLGQPIVDGLVVAILFGVAIRTFWTIPPQFAEGVDFTARQLLEVAVLLLGASVDLPLLLSAGPGLAAGIVLLVMLGLGATYGIGRALRLPHKLAVLVAGGNAICGNSAIAALAPVIRAEKEHVASSIAFTAVLGVAVVIGLPLLIRPLGFDHYQYGVLAGMTVYAVPQVLAATFPVSLLSGQVGTLVKLVRVMMLGPVVLFFAVTHREPARPGTAPLRLPVTTLVPWFIVGFLLLAVLRSAGMIPEPLVAASMIASSWLTVAAMAALGLGVDIRAITRVGRPVILTVAASLAVLLLLSVALIHLLHLR